MIERSSSPKIKVSDKRIKHDAPKAAAVPEPASDDVAEEEAKHDYLEDLQRLQAEFDNYRRRMMQQQTQMAERASARLVEHLLPVLDNLDRARAHDGNGGLALVHKELLGVLQGEGLEEIPAEGAPFDPTVHEAVESHEDAEVEHPTVTEVYRTGYRLKGKVLRPAMVVVARPVEEADTPPRTPSR